MVFGLSSSSPYLLLLVSSPTAFPSIASSFPHASTAFCHRLLNDQELHRRPSLSSLPLLFANFIAMPKTSAADSDDSEEDFKPPKAKKAKPSKRKAVKEEEEDGDDDSDDDGGGGGCEAQRRRRGVLRSGRQKALHGQEVEEERPRGYPRGAYPW